MENQELVDIKTIAQRTGYSTKYLSNRWPQILLGIKPLKFVRNGKVLFKWSDIVQRLAQPK